MEVGEKPDMPGISGEHHSQVIETLDKLYEFEHEPVSEDKLQPAKYFAGLFAGEHVAATEFVIGTTFVAWGVSAKDVFVGLLLGNTMAVLMWALICTPIAVQTRLTLYWYLRKIAGPVTTAIYNFLNAVLFAILCGCMITVASSAVRIPFNIPAQVHWYPQDLRFVLVVICVGAVVVTLAILGFKKLAQFATVCSPWLLMMFFAGAVATLPGLAKSVGIEIKSFGDFWTVANKVIWTGSTPTGNPPMTFWQVAAFAWVCNVPFHVCLSDMALLRYAKKTSYGLFSILGMFLGHYLAWICAGVMAAAASVFVGTSILNLDSGGVAMQALGICGIIAVIIAGWTTANPTLYRVGLGFQAIAGNLPRWLVTLLAGIATVIIACFPFVFTGLLQFVGYFGLLLMPVGAIVFTEHWIFPLIGFTRYWVSYKKLTVSWPAVATWAIGVAVALLLERTGILHLFYLLVPIWILSMALYIIFASMAGAREKFDEPLKEQTAADIASQQPVTQEGSSALAGENATAAPDIVLLLSRIAAVGSLLACLALPLWVYFSKPENYERNFAAFKTILIWPTVIYFISGTIWAVKRNKEK